MAKHLALDSGGTKLAAILYDDSFLPIKTAKVGSVRFSTTPPDMVNNNIELLFEQLEVNESTVISRVSGTLEHYLTQRLAEKCIIEQTVPLGEHGLGLSAAGVFGDGILSLSGTGAVTYAKTNGKRYVFGGYGNAVSDEGSGYWMGRMAMDYAIKSFEGRGEKTILEDMICERFSRDNLHDAIFSLYSIKEISPVLSVASCAKLVDKAADLGDNAAIQIIKATGRSLAEQLVALMRMYSISPTTPITISGSVWRGHKLLMKAFRETLLKYDDRIVVIVPEFEPVMGALIRHFYEKEQKFDKEVIEFFKKNYQNYLFKIKE